MEPLIGQIILFAGKFAPQGWAICNGQLLEIATNTGLFSVIGTTYGGDGHQTFALPDLRGRVPIQEGKGLDLPNVDLGDQGNYFSSSTFNLQSNDELPFTTLKNLKKPINNNPNHHLPPYLVVNYIIAIRGTFPSTR